MKPDIPIYTATITDDEDGIYCMSLVDAPATEVNWVCFKADKPMQTYTIQDEEQHLLCSVAMVCNTPIYRRDEGGEYYITYPPDTIRQMAEKMLADNAFNTIDIQHDGNTLPKGAVTLGECYIKDEAKGINPKFLDVPDGSMMVTYKVHDPQLWDRCKCGELNGFSLAGFFTIKREKQNNEHKMSKLKQILSLLLKAEFGSAKAEDGMVIYYPEELAEGVEVTDAEGNPIADGDYVVDGKVISVKDGIVAKIEDAPKAEDKPKEDKPKEDKKEEENEEEPNAEVEELKAQVDELRGVLEELKSRLEALEGKPSSEPIAEQFSAISTTETKDKRLQRAFEIAKGVKI